MRRGLLAMSAAGVLGFGTHAAAQTKAPLGDALEVHADDAGCVTEPALRARVQRWLKPQGVAPDVQVEVDAAASPPRFSVRRDADEVAARSFDVLPAACSDRLDAIAIAVALAIEHATNPASAETAATGTSEAAASDTNANAAERAPPPATPAPATPPNPARATSTPGGEAERQEPQETEADRRAAHARWAAPHVYAGGGVMFKVLPELVPAFALGADLALDSFRLSPDSPLGWLRLDVALLATTQTGTEIGPGTLYANLIGGRVLFCSEVALGKLGLATCSGAGGGAALASGNGYQQPDHPVAGWLAGIARGFIRFPASGVFSLRLAADALVNIVRPRLIVQGDRGGTRTAGVVGVAGSLELVLALP